MSDGSHLGGTLTIPLKTTHNWHNWGQKRCRNVANRVGRRKRVGGGCVRRREGVVGQGRLCHDDMVICVRWLVCLGAGGAVGRRARTFARNAGKPTTVSPKTSFLGFLFPNTEMMFAPVLIPLTAFPCVYLCLCLNACQDHSLCPYYSLLQRSVTCFECCP